MLRLSIPSTLRSVLSTAAPSSPAGSLWARGAAALAVAALFLPVGLGAQPPRGDRSGEMAKDMKKEAGAEQLLEESRASKAGRITVDGETIAYTATAGTMVLTDEEGNQRASIFYISYVKDGEGQDGEIPADRPVTFSFNGGPGSSSVWLHLGIFGPHRVDLGPEGLTPPVPGRLVENGSTLLDATDLVFIDPVATGFSRSAADVEDAEFHGLREDVESVGAFIRRWVAENDRWDSPKLLVGESYGTTRASALVRYLQGRHGMYFNGVMLVSSILNFQTARFDVGNDLPYPLFLPTYAATARFHGALSPELNQRPLEEFLDEVETFALGDYWSALALGDRLDDATRRSVLERLARYTGLSEEYLEDTDLRPVIHQFTKELLREEGRTVGRLDSRFKGHDRLDIGDRGEFDPSYAGIQGAYTAGLNQLVREELGFESTLDYEILGGRIRRWSYDDWENRYVNMAEELRAAMTQNPTLKVHVANGYYDLATPYFATEYTFDHLGLPEALRDNVSMSYYEAGHMMYIQEESLERLDEVLEEFVESVSTDAVARTF